MYKSTAAIALLLAAANGFSPSRTSLPRRPHAQRAEAAVTTMKISNVFIAGASNGVGREIATQLLAQDCRVTALVRTEEAASELSALGIHAFVGDALEYKTVEGAMDGCDCAVSTLGGVRDGQRVDYTGNVNVIEAAGILGVVRMVLVTSIGCGDSKDALPPSVYEVLESALEAKSKAENVLAKYYTNMDWTIIRPGGLVTASATGAAKLLDDPNSIGTIRRADVAALVINSLSDENTIRKTLSAVDPTLEAGESGEVVDGE